jgi:hypothetical protein
MNQPKKLQIISIVMTIASLLAVIPAVHSIEIDSSEKALSFMTDVVQLDMSKYTATLKGYSADNPSKIDGVTQEELTYVLEAQDSTITVSCTFTNNALRYYLQTTTKGSPLYTQKSTNVLDEAKNILERYQLWTGDSSITGMADILGMVDKTKDDTVIVGNVKLEVFWYGEYASFYWRHSVNGADYSAMGFAFDKDKFAFGDDRSLYKIGSTDIKVSMQEAIDIALQRVENFSWEITMGDEPNLKVTDFTIAKENITAKLLTWPKETLTLYPYWSINLGLDRSYPGFVNAIQVGVWADSGEAFLCYPVGYGGTIPVDNPTTEPTLTPSLQPTASALPTKQSESNDSLPLNISIAAIAITAITATIIMAIKKKIK